MGESMQAGRLAARAIKANGVDTLFTLSGGHVMPIYEGCRVEGVRVIDVRHEQAAAHAAEAWGRVNRACGVALVTSGPGVTGVVTAVANCKVAQTPLVVIGGARPLVQAEQGALQELDQLSIFKPITKWAAVCTHPERVPDLISTAFRQALAQPRGPVYLELPMDILFADAEEERRAGTLPLRRARLRRPEGDDEGRRPAHEGGAARGDRRERDLVGRRLEAARRLRRERAAAHLPQRLGARRAAARPRAVLPALTQLRRRRRRRRLRDRHSARLPAQVRALQPRGEARPHPFRSDGARSQPRAGRRDRRRLRSRARDPGRRRQEPPPERRVARAAPRHRPGLVGRQPRLDRVGERSSQPLPPRRGARQGARPRPRS